MSVLEVDKLTGQLGNKLSFNKLLPVINQNVPSYVYCIVTLIN